MRSFATGGLSSSMYFTVESPEEPHEYTFTCISTGRPISNMTWFFGYNFNISECIHTYREPILDD